jgi:hypothetical protein
MYLALVLGSSPRLFPKAPKTDGLQVCTLRSILVGFQPPHMMAFHLMNTKILKTEFPQIKIYPCNANEHSQ